MRAWTRFLLVVLVGAFAPGCIEEPSDPGALDAALDAAARDASGDPSEGDTGPAALDATTQPAIDAASPKDAGRDDDAARDGAAASDGSAADAQVDATPDAAPDAHASEAGEPACAACCADGFPRGAMGSAARRVVSLEPSPEGVAVCPGGELFVALDGAGEIWRVPLADGAPERWATLGDRRPAGLSCDEHGRLFAAIFTSRSGDAIPIEVLMVAGKDAAPVPMPAPEDEPPLGGLNGIVAATGVGVYATDTLSGRIVHVREAAPGRFETRVVASDVPLANGLAYHRGKRELYAVASGAFTVFAFRVGPDGALSERREVPISGLVLFADGVAVDAAGEVYVADYLRAKVVRASDGQAVAELPNPASLAFRGGTLFITSYDVLDQKAEGALYALDLGACGG